MTALLEIDALHKHFPIGDSGLLGRKQRPMLHAVDGVSFGIHRGETVGLVGESGCGKSTLVRLISRLLDPTAGAIRLGGQDLAGIPAARFARSPHRVRVQMVFQDAQDSLNPRFTAGRAIADPLMRLKGMGGKELSRQVEEVAALCGLAPELLSRFPHQLSGGQKARVGIARAVAVEPELLILDEPTSALDVSVQVVILRLLEDLKRRLGMSYLFVSHDLNVVRLICDRVLVMYLGRIVESGSAAALFDTPAHPYTRALVSSVPQIRSDRPAEAGEGMRMRLHGEPKSPIDPNPTVCRFHGRCPKGADPCTQSGPVLRPVGPGHEVACHLPELPIAAE